MSTNMGTHMSSSMAADLGDSMIAGCGGVRRLSGRHYIVMLLVAAGLSSPAMGQSLFRQPAPAAAPRVSDPAPGTALPIPVRAPVPVGQEPAPAAVVPTSSAPEVVQPAPLVAPVRAVMPELSLHEASLLAVTPPEPRTYQKNDTVQIIINESSLQKLEQSLSTEKEYDIQAALRAFPSLEKLLELQFKAGDANDLAELDVGYEQEYDGEGTFERRNRLTDRISALVLEVKPNGLLVVEARRTVKIDEEEVSVVLSGLCSQDDITSSNTIQSSQIANFNLIVEHRGEVRKAAKKGLIPRMLEAVFNF